AVVDADLLKCVAELFESPKKEVRGWTSGILEKLARHERAARLVVAHVVSLLRGEDDSVVGSAAETLYLIARRPDGAQLVADANVLESIPQLFSSSNDEVRRWTGENLGVIESAAKTLCLIAASPDGAQAVVDADGVAELFESPKKEVRGWTSGILEKLARHERAERLVVAHVVSLLRGENDSVVGSAVETLCLIAASPDSAQAVVDADLLKCVAELFESPKKEVRDQHRRSWRSWHAMNAQRGRPWHTWYPS
ncbi:armadillo-type protein, partial [Mycena leptocephala]